LNIDHVSFIQGIKLTDSQKQKIKIRKQRQWFKIKSDPKLYAEFNEKRIARKHKRMNFVKANPELNEVRKRKNREHMQPYRERLKKEKMKMNELSGLFKNRFTLTGLWKGV